MGRVEERESEGVAGGQMGEREGINHPFPIFGQWRERFTCGRRTCKISVLVKTQPDFDF